VAFSKAELETAQDLVRAWAKPFPQRAMPTATMGG